MQLGPPSQPEPIPSARHTYAHNSLASPLPVSYVQQCLERHKLRSTHVRFNLKSMDINVYQIRDQIQAMDITDHGFRGCKITVVRLYASECASIFSHHWSY